MNQILNQQSDGWAAWLGFQQDADRNAMMACTVASHSQKGNEINSRRTQWEGVDLKGHYLFLLDRLQYLDYAFLIVVYIDALKDFAILAAPNLSHNLIVVLISAQEKVWVWLWVTKTKPRSSWRWTSTPTAQIRSRSPSSPWAY